MLKMQQYRRSSRRLVYNLMKRPVRPVRNWYLHTQARQFFDVAVDESDYTWGDLARVEEYFEYAFGRQKPVFPEPFQQPFRYFPGLRAHPVWNPGEFPFLDDLVQRREEIRYEFDRYRTTGSLAVHHQRLNDAGKWNVLYLRAAGTSNPLAGECFPAATQATAALPGMGVVGQAYFSLLAPGTHIPAHCGPTNTKLRVQVRLDVPAGCEMRVGDHTHSWDDGDDVLVFDDSFEHEVWIRGERERSVLIVDFPHPDLTAAELWALEAIDNKMPDRRRYSSLVKSNGQRPEVA